MGCTESLPAPGALDEPHQINPKTPYLGGGFGATPSKTEKTVVLVRQNLFSWSGSSFRINTRDGQPYGNDLRVKGKAMGFRDQMTMVDGKGQAVAVVLRKFELIGQTFKIYMTSPVFDGQKPSDRKYQGSNLYTFAKVERQPFTFIQNITLEGDTGVSYTVTRSGSWWPKTRTVKRHGKPCALMEGGTWEGTWSSYAITCAPGIDPCLLVCVCAICDEMDETEAKEKRKKRKR
jgi:hypothetical protein